MGLGTAIRHGVADVTAVSPDIHRGVSDQLRPPQHEVRHRLRRSRKVAQASIPSPSSSSMIFAALAVPAHVPAPRAVLGHSRRPGDRGAHDRRSGAAAHRAVHTGSPTSSRRISSSSPRRRRCFFSRPTTPTRNKSCRPPDAAIPAGHRKFHVQRFFVRARLSNFTGAPAWHGLNDTAVDARRAARG